MVFSRKGISFVECPFFITIHKSLFSYKRTNERVKTIYPHFALFLYVNVAVSCFDKKRFMAIVV